MGIGYDRHVFVCENERDCGHPRGCCTSRGGPQIRAWFKEMIKERKKAGLPAGAPKVRAQRAGCLDYCELGPLCVVYPEGIWYRPANQDDVAEIIDRHLYGGEIVERLRVGSDTLTAEKSAPRATQQATQQATQRDET